MKRERRKPPPKRKIKPVLDDDMIELASVIAEHQLEQNAKGWFTVPWRSGWNAARLAREAWEYEYGSTFVVSFGGLDRVFERETIDGEIYESLDDLRAEWAGKQGTKGLRAAARILQIMHARSDGGGHVYNDVLRRLFDDELEENCLEAFVSLVRNHRRRDVLGTPGHMHPNTHARRMQRVFDIAWDRGLFFAAYAINPITKES